jgi:hypothetical protein
VHAVSVTDHPHFKEGNKTMRTTQAKWIFGIVFCLTGIIVGVSVASTGKMSSSRSIVNTAGINTQNDADKSLREKAKVAGHYTTEWDDPKWKEKHELKTLTKKSSLIVKGVAYNGFCKLSADGKLITTEYVVTIDSVLKGVAPKENRVQLSLPGGLVRFPEGTSATVRTPTFRKMANGRSYILFLEPGSQDGLFSLVGGPQGLFEISSDGLTAVHFSGDLSLPPPQPQNLADLISEIEKNIKKKDL